MSPSFHLHCAQIGFKPWDNPDNLMDQETSNTIVTIINVGILPPVVLVGVVTNLINIAVFTKQVGSTACFGIILVMVTVHWIFPPILFAR